MTRLKYLLLASILVMGCSQDDSETSVTQTDPVEQLAQWCYTDWAQKDWTLGDSEVLAKNNEAFSGGIRKVCQARAELYAEGYDLYPFIADKSQREIYALVFTASVDEIKSHLRSHLPALQKI